MIESTIELIDLLVLAALAPFLAVRRRFWRPARSVDRPGGRLFQILRALFHCFTAWHDRLYSWTVGAHPHRRLWHPQWLSVKDLYRDFRRIFPTLEGEVLDVGCLGKPYAGWLTNATRHIGIDVAPAPTVDYLIRDGEPWPLETGRFQSAICTQAVSVVKDLPHMMRELHRVLTPNGLAVIATPFCYHDLSTGEGASVYKDYWRHTVYGVQELVADGFEVVEIRRQGGIGSTVGVMLLNWVHLTISSHPIGRLLLMLALPVDLMLCLIANLIGALLDRLDRTELFYHNVLLVVRKKVSAGDELPSGGRQSHDQPREASHRARDEEQAPEVQPAVFSRTQGNR